MAVNKKIVRISKSKYEELKKENARLKKKLDKAEIALGIVEELKKAKNK